MAWLEETATLDFISHRFVDWLPGEIIVRTSVPHPDLRSTARALSVMRQPNLTYDTMPPPFAATHPSHPLSLWGLWLAVILAIGPFIVRRIILLGDDNYAHWLAIDYSARCISLIGVIVGLSLIHI